jgi:hypothetical protein
MGPIDHGMCKSIYFAGPDSMALEVAWSGEAIDARRWIDPAVLAKAGISAEEAAQYKSPAPYTGASPVPQPTFDEAKPHMPYPRELYLKMVAVPDEVISRRSKFADPPVPADAS